MGELNKFINHYFGIILLTSALAGLFLPAFNFNSSLIIIISLAVVIFSSYFRISLNRELLKTDWKSIFYFYSIRFILFPAIFYVSIKPISTFYSISFFLLLLLPAAVSSPAFAAMYHGRVSLALKVLIFSSFASIFFIPVLSGAMLRQSVKIDSRHMFLILVYTLVLPFLLHIPLRKSKIISAFFTENNPLVTALGLISIFVISISKNRAIIFENPKKVIVYAAVSLVFFMALYIIGYYINFKCDQKSRVTFSVTSGANNIGMGVTLTMLFFPGNINVFFIVSQLAWIFVLIPMRYFYRYKTSM
jgi:predicted Na+-dependent transporter